MGLPKAIEWLKSMQKSCEGVFAPVDEENCNYIINALEELQEYRNIGTVGGFYFLTNQYKQHANNECSQDKSCKTLIRYKERLKEYKRIGTVEELKLLKAKQTSRYIDCGDGEYLDGSVVYNTAYCPECDHVFTDDSDEWRCNYCPECGQRLDWNEMDSAEEDDEEYDGEDEE